MGTRTQRRQIVAVVVMVLMLIMVIGSFGWLTLGAGIWASYSIWKWANRKACGNCPSLDTVQFRRMLPDDPWSESTDPFAVEILHCNACGQEETIGEYLHNSFGTMIPVPRGPS